jgi:hypothetical protein
MERSIIGRLETLFGVGGGLYGIAVTLATTWVIRSTGAAPCDEVPNTGCIAGVNSLTMTFLILFGVLSLAVLVGALAHGRWKHSGALGVLLLCTVVLAMETLLAILSIGVLLAPAMLAAVVSSLCALVGLVESHPTDAWVAQRWREATLFGMAPRFLTRDNDSKLGPLFARVASTSSIKVLMTPFYAPRANAYCERFLGSVRRECLDHLLILHEQQLFRVLQGYVTYFNRARPHQGLQQQLPDPPASALLDDAGDGPIVAVPILGSLHHEYRRVA